MAPTETLPDELEGRFDDRGVWKHEPALGPCEWGEDAATALERKEFMVTLQHCLDGLPPRCAEAFILREMEALSADRVQEILGVSPANFWVLMHRARMQLRLCLEENWFKR